MTKPTVKDEKEKLTCPKHNRILIGKERCVDCEFTKGIKVTPYRKKCNCICHNKQDEDRFDGDRCDAYCKHCQPPEKKCNCTLHSDNTITCDKHYPPENENGWLQQFYKRLSKEDRILLKTEIDFLLSQSHTQYEEVHGDFEKESDDFIEAITAWDVDDWNKEGLKQAQEGMKKIIRKSHTQNVKEWEKKISRHDKQTCIDRNGYIDPISGKWECEYNQALDCVFSLLGTKLKGEL